jgi:YidC/Oxa1 family membrane protein insertase
VGPENRRILIVTVSTVAIFLVWSQFFGPKPKPQGAAPAAVASAPQAAGAAAPGQPAAAAAVPVAEATQAPEELVTLAGQGFSVVLSSHGGAVAHVELLGKKFQHDVDGKAVPIDLIHVAKGHPLPLSLAASPELGGQADPLLDPGARAPMRVSLGTPAA